MSTQQPQSLQQYIDNQKTQYATQKGIQASNDYILIITPFVNQIWHLIQISLELKDTQDKLPKKQRVKIIQKGKK